MRHSKLTPGKFKVDYNYDDPSNVHDATTWEVYVAGDPLRIVE